MHSRSNDSAMAYLWLRIVYSPWLASCSAYPADSGPSRFFAAASHFSPPGICLIKLLSMFKGITQVPDDQIGCRMGEVELLKAGGRLPVQSQGLLRLARGQVGIAEVIQRVDCVRMEGPKRHCACIAHLLGQRDGLGRPADRPGTCGRGCRGC